MEATEKTYVTPAIETLDSNEILDLIGPVQGYGPGSMESGSGMLISPTAGAGSNRSSIGGR